MKNKAKLIMHPIRMRILLNLSEDQLTSQELSQKLSDVPQATLYRHIKTLYKAGLLKVVEERQIRNVTEKVYSLAAGAAALSAEDLAEATLDDHMNFFTVFVSSLLADYSRYLESDQANPLKDGTGYSQVPLNLTNKELIQLVQGINSMIIPLLENKLEGGRRRRVLTTILIPDDHEPPDTSGD